MNDSNTRKDLPPQPTVELIEKFTSAELNDLCDATEAAINGGGGFGWVNIPNRDALERYWQGVIAMPARMLLVARLDGVICGTCQLWKPPAHNEAQAHTVTLTTNFIVPWARGHGLAKMLVERAENVAKTEGFSVINLEVRETMYRAIDLYESLNYTRFGTHPYSVRVDNETLAGHFYYKVINEDAVKK